MAGMVNRRFYAGPLDDALPPIDDAMRIIEADTAQGVALKIRETSITGLFHGRMSEVWPADLGEPVKGWTPGEIQVWGFSQEDVVRKLAYIIADCRMEAP